MSVELEWLKQGLHAEKALSKRREKALEQEVAQLKAGQNRSVLVAKLQQQNQGLRNHISHLAHGNEQVADDTLRGEILQVARNINV